MSTKHIRWLLVVVIAELLIIIGLVIWALARPETVSAPQEIVASTEEGTFTTSLIATGFDTPTDIATTPIADDDRLFVVQQAGKISSINKHGGEAAADFLDISAKVKAGGEMGLLGLAFHPTFAQNGYFYVNYIDKDLNTIVSRYQVNASGVADPASEKILLKVKQPFSNHNAGALAFGPDGYLYIPLGDGGGGGDPQNHSQTKNDFLGKLLRINVDAGDPYAIPADNPFVADSAYKPEIWAIGFRNPWRISFDSKTGELYIADVGQGDIEEVDIQPATSKGGENYGWRCYEGTQAFNTDGCQAVSTFTLPAFEYTHDDGRCSITGGYVYRGTHITSLDGQYVFGDYCTGEIFAASQKDGTWTQRLLLETPYMISTFGQDKQGEMYVADMASGSVYSLGVTQ